MTTDAAPSTLASKLRDGRFVMTAEITPPVSCSAADMLDKALPLRGFADAVNVTDGASAMSMMSSLAASALLAQNGLEPIMQFTCRDRNRIAIQADLMGAGALGVRNFLMLHGDDPKAGDQPEPKSPAVWNSGISSSSVLLMPACVASARPRAPVKPLSRVTMAPLGLPVVPEL